MTASALASTSALSPSLSPHSVSPRFTSRQFQAGNSQAVRLPAEIAFPPKTELVLVREGDRIIVQPRAASMEQLPALLAALKPATSGQAFVRPEFIDAERDWGGDGKSDGKSDGGGHAP